MSPDRIDFLANGVTTIRTTAAFEPYADLEIKKKVDAGNLIGPKIHAAIRCGYCV